MASSNIDLYVDEAYLLALLNDEPIPISDEKYAQELHLQEALFSSSSIHAIPLFFHSIKTEHDDKQSIQENRERGESSHSIPLFFHSIKTEHEEKQSIQENREQLIFCGICMDYKQSPEIFKGLTNCNHEFCTACMIKYVASRIRENCGLVECPDPKCRRKIEPEICSSILPKDVFGRWENALFEAMIPGGQKVYCPYKNCSVLMVDDGEVEVRMSECPGCRRLFCARCRVPWHQGVTCEEFDVLGKDERGEEDIMVMKLAKDKQWRRCPNCRIFVERIDGCLHMTCRCRNEFCYQCGDKWSSTHAHA